MDLEPRNPETAAGAGRAFDRHSIVGPMLARAMAEGKPVASDPIPLQRQNGPVGVVLAAPCFQEGASDPAGLRHFLL